MASAFEWGSKGRGFKSHLPDQIKLGAFFEEKVRFSKSFCAKTFFIVTPFIFRD